MSVKVNPLHIDSITGTCIDNCIDNSYNPNYWDESFAAPQGWQCPICKRVYSPSTPWCYFCGNTETKATTTTTFVTGVLRDDEDHPKAKLTTYPPKKRKVYRAKVKK